ncbi:MAG: NAD(P)H-hydrate dehydratase [Planctomycetota bacterium]|nr:NAD(P)H-hydrate dehydratase [Planctomycetota bacterium]
MSSYPPVHLPSRRRDAHKGSFGSVLMIGGSRGMSGSIAMSAVAALRTGAGLVTAAIPDRCLETVAAFHPAIMTLAVDETQEGAFSDQAVSQLGKRVSGVSAIGCGPGMTTGSGSIRMVERLLETRSSPMVLDADGLNCLAALSYSDPTGMNTATLENKWGDVGGPLVLTPHPGEWERLSGVPASDRDGQLEAAEVLSRKKDIVIVVKGGPTCVVHSGGVWTNQTGNPGMATAGSGDVLTGVITALLAQQLSPWDAARLGVWVHGLAGDLAAVSHGQIGMTSCEILDFLPQAMMSVYKS